MNLVSLIGRVVKEVEVQQLQPSGKSVFNNTIAVQNVYRNSDDSYHSHFIQVVAWGKIAERIGKFVKKGTALAWKDDSILVATQTRIIKKCM